MVVKRILILVLLSSCSWEYHRTHFETDFYNPQPGEFYSQQDSILDHNHGPCLRTNYFIHRGNWRHMSACKCPENWQVDSAFDKKGRLYLSRKYHTNRTESYLYDSTLVIYYDRRERPIKQFININKPGRSEEYWQYFNEDGTVEELKRPVIYQLLDE